MNYQINLYCLNNKIIIIIKKYTILTNMLLTIVKICKQNKITEIIPKSKEFPK